MNTAHDTEAFIRQAKQELDRLRSILDTAVDGIITIKSDGTVDQMNPAAERIFGYSAEEVIGKNISMLMPSPYREQHDQFLQRYLRTRERHIIGIGREVLGRRKDGSVFPIDLAVGECGAGNDIRFTGFVRDVTWRREHERRLSEQAQLLDNVREAIVICDLEQTITYWNRGAEHLYGWTAAEAVGQSREAFLRWTPPSGISLEEINRHVLQQEEWQGELTQNTRDGRQLAAASYWTLIRDEADQPKAQLIINIDVTERKKLEAQFLRAQRLESIGVLAGGIAHDLNNVLTPILMSVKLLRKEWPAAQRQELLDTAHASVERGIGMVKQLLSFAGGMEGERTVIALPQLIGEVEKMLLHTLPKTIQIKTRIQPDLWTLKGDKTQLSQVLMNLCVNARDAMPQGGRLTISAENCALKGDYTQFHPDAKPGPYVQLAVADTGMGIPPGAMDKIFDPFFTTKGIGKGTGLGLSTVLGIARSHGGIVNVYSEEGQGTRVTVYLPASGVSLLAEQSPIATPPPKGNGELILVVDDEPLILRTVREVLESQGYRVVTAEHGLAARELYGNRHQEVQAVLLDMMMPGLDGLAVLRELQEIDSSVRVIGCSGLRSAERLRALFAAGAKAFLQKPYSEEQLLHTLHQVLTARESSGKGDSGE